MRKLYLMTVCFLMFLTGCWNNQEVDESAFVHGVGLDKAGDKIKVSVELIRPSSGQGGQTTGKEDGQHIILEKSAETLLEAGRELIRTAKRRLYFGHTSTFILGEELAREHEFPLVLDIIRRDQMLRLNSYLFITDNNPSEIFNTPTLYEDLTSTELVSVLEQTKYISEYSPINFYEFYRFLKTHNYNAYLPIISIQDSFDQKVTAISSTAVIKDNQMVGKLNIRESAGLNWLLNQVKGGTITVELGEKRRTSIEVTYAKTKLEPCLDGNRLKVDIYTNIKGTLADNVTRDILNKSFIKEVEKNTSQEVKTLMISSLKKLQELGTDITDFGLVLYQRNPKDWKLVKSQWNDIFAKAEVTIHIDTKITHQGMTNESLHIEKQKPDNNPYRFLKYLFRR